MTLAKISGHEYSGRDLGSIVRREYGRRAGILLSSDPNAPQVGTVVRWSRSGGAWSVLGVVRWADGELGDVEPRRRAGGVL